MNQRLVICLTCVALCCQSCASLLNKPTTFIEIHSKEGHRVNYSRDSSIQTPCILEVQRSADPLSIRLVGESGEDTLVVKAQYSGQMLFGNLLFFTLAPVGYAIDIIGGNKMKYSYPDVIEIDQGRGMKFTNKHAFRKGQKNLDISMPFMNASDYQGEFKYRSDLIGFLTAGFTCYHRDNASFQLCLGTTFPHFRGWELQKGDRNIMQTFQYIKASLVHDLGFIEIGYGLNWTCVSSFIDFKNPDAPNPVSYLKEREYFAGAGLLVRIHPLPHCYVGFNEMLSGYNLNRRKWDALNLFYIEWGLNIPLNYPQKLPVVAYDLPIMIKP